MYFAPIIIFFEDNIESIDFFNGCTLRQIKPEELEKFFYVSIQFKNQRPEKINRVSTNYHYEPKYGLWSDIPKPFIPYFQDDINYPYYIIESENPEEISEILISLRILKDDIFFCPISVNDSNSNFHYYLPFNNSINFDYFLKLEEIELLKNIVKNVPKLNEVIRKRFLIAADHDLNNKVKVVELVSIMESLLCGNEKNELRFRFALFSSFIINKFRKTTSFQEMKYFYDLRSELVHTGNSKKFTNQSLFRINFLSRELIKQYLLENFSPSKIEDWIFRDLGISEEKNKITKT